jgi:DNA-binding transcriptional regulator LsrR (DeoR family)
MRRPRAEDPRVDMLAAAFLAGEGKKQKDVAEALGLSQAAISRHLAAAREKYLREEVHFAVENVSDEEMQKVRQRISRKGLQEQLDLLAQQEGRSRKVFLRVFDCGPGSNDAERIRKLGEYAATHVRGLLVRARVCGLTWGGMLNSVVNGLRNLHAPAPWAAAEIQCIPLSGEPLGEDPTSFSSSSLAHVLGDIVNGDQYDAPSIAMVPAFVPDRFPRNEINGVWRLIELVESYHKIFGEHLNGKPKPPKAKAEPPLAECLDMVLTSVGSAEKPLGFGRGLLFKQMNVTLPELKTLIVAEVGGVCIPRLNLDKKQTRRFESVRRCWTGLQKEHLIKCSARGSDAYDKGPPGVVVVSGGTGRAAPICELIKLGLVNHLIIDDVLANELEKASCAKLKT